MAKGKVGSKNSGKPLVLLIGCSNRSARGKVICNTDLSLWVVKEGIGKLANVKMFSLINCYPLLSDIKKASGIIFATPVYFGWYSSLLQEFLEWLRKKKIELYPKVVGFIVVGAKRNGGQESTIINASWDVMGLGACVVNDGAPISQFGGVVVAGDKGDIFKDKEGLETCRNLGRRVSETSLILKNGKKNIKTRINIWKTEELQNTLLRCLACDKCPNPNRKDDYGCVLPDMMSSFHYDLLKSEGIIPKGFGLRFFERTRYLRRDNYRLTYSVACLKNIRHVPLFIKLNCILCRKNLKIYSSLISSGRKRLKLSKQIYQPIGYKK